MFKFVFCVILLSHEASLQRRYEVVEPSQETLDLRIRTQKQVSSNIQDTFVLGSCIVVLNRICPDRDVSFFLYTSENPTTPQPVRIGADYFSSNLSQTSFDPTLPTKIIVHGYNSDMNLRVLVEVRKEYMKSGNVNVFAVNWGNLAQGPCYPAAVWNSRFAGKCSAQLIERILEFGAKDIHVIGFSLGAHVTGYIANNIRPYKLPRITGLDPAMPGFITVGPEDKLDKGDAEFVDIIHTNAFLQGKVEESGHVDFFVNGGVIQPGCWAESRFFACNHHRAPLYFAESINTKVAFYGWPCPSYWVYLTGNCPPKEPQILMGEHISRSSSGVHLVITGSVSPYAVGKYTGPTIEIFLRDMEKRRLADLDRFKNDMRYFYDIDDVLGTLRQAHKRKLGPQRTNRRPIIYPEMLNDIFEVTLNYTEYLQH